MPNPKSVLSGVVDLRGALDYWGGHWLEPMGDPNGYKEPEALVIYRAVELIADPNTLVITKQDGQWSEAVVQRIWVWANDLDLSPQELLDDLLVVEQQS